MKVFKDFWPETMVMGKLVTNTWQQMKSQVMGEELPQ